MGQMVLARAVAAKRRCLWLTHTKELVAQSARRLGAGIIAAGYPRTAANLIQVASIQTLLAREIWEPFDVVVFDECHHAASERYAELLNMWLGAFWLGLTATPQRSDGRPLGGMFEALVVAAHHSELLRGGHLVSVRLFRPDRELDRGIATDVLGAIQKHGTGRTGFVYCGSVDRAKVIAGILSLSDIPAVCVHDSTPREEREDALKKLGTGELRFITNVNTMTEGVDVPSASMCVFESSIGHLSTAIQRWGRVLRACDGKRDAIICDLPGVTHRPGWIPLQDLDYSLDGDGIRPRAGAPSLHVCLKCGFVWETGAACERCGWRPPVKAKEGPRIYNKELLEVYCGQQTPEWAKKAEWNRLVELCRGRKINVTFAESQYRKLFQEDPPREIRGDVEQMRADWDQFRAEAKRRGYKPGWAAFQFRTVYGASPPRSWWKEGDIS